MLETFYDEGWNAYLQGNPYDPANSRDWRDGWKDCQGADPSDQLPV